MMVLNAARESDGEKNLQQPSGYLPVKGGP